MRLDARDDGMSALTASWATPLARACYQALAAYAQACEFDEDGNRDPRTHQQRMADCLADLILRPHADRPAVQIVLTLVAGVDTLTGHGPGADEPGEVDGDLVPAALVRELATRSACCPGPAPPTARQHRRPARGQRRDGPTREAVDTTAGEEATALAGLRAEELAAAEELRTAHAAARDRRRQTTGAARAALARLLNARRLIDTALAERPRIAVVDQLSGALLALTDSTELRAAATAGR